MTREPLTPAIEEATLFHAGAMAEIHQAAFAPAEQWSSDVMLLQLELPTTYGFIQAHGGLILARVVSDESEILTLAVTPGQRRRGLGAALLRAAIDRAVHLGAASMFLEVAVSNRAARALYEAHGFAEAGLRRHYYSDGADALILRSSLPSSHRNS
jgi:ribosomal-protein-alanine N-acetyltransferase